MKQLLNALIGILIASNLYGQDSTSLYDVPDSIRQYIINRVSRNILQYRVDYNPALTEADKIYKKVGNETLYKDAPWILFEDPEVYESPELVMKVKRWPEDHPRLNYYLVTKAGNYIVPHYSTYRLRFLFTDTLRSAKYDSYNKYFPHDERFLVYYDEKKETYKNLSGNFYQHGINGPWFKFGSSVVPEVRLAQYQVGDVFKFVIKGDITTYMINRSRVITHGNPGNIIVNVLNKYPYNYLEIIFYSNKVEVTGDNNNTHFYEIKQVRDYMRGYPYKPEDLKPTVRLLKRKEIEALERHYGLPIYNFGNIDQTGVPIKK